MADEQTLATELRLLFQQFAADPDCMMYDAISRATGTPVGSEQFFQVVAAAKARCDQLTADIRSSSLKSMSKDLYIGAVYTLSTYISLDGLNSKMNRSLRGEHQAFEYLTLVDDVLSPLDRRDLPEGFLQGIREKANEMLVDLQESGIDTRLKMHLENQIKHFLWSIDTFGVLGMEGLTKSWGAMAAEIARSQGMAPAKKPDAEAWYKRALPILGAIGLAITSVSATVEQTDNLLTHGEHIVTVLTGKHEDTRAAEAEPKHKEVAQDETNNGGASKEAE